MKTISEIFAHFGVKNHLLEEELGKMFSDLLREREFYRGALGRFNKIALIRQRSKYFPKSVPDKLDVSESQLRQAMLKECEMYRKSLKEIYPDLFELKRPDSFTEVVELFNEEHSKLRNRLQKGEKK